MTAQVSMAHFLGQYQKKLTLQLLNWPLRHRFDEKDFPNQGFLYKICQSPRKLYFYEFLEETSLIAFPIKSEKCRSQMKIRKRTDRNDGRE